MHPSESVVTSSQAFWRLLGFCLRPRRGLVIAVAALILAFNIVELALPKILALYVRSFEKHGVLQLWGMDLEFLRSDQGRTFLLPGALLVVAGLRWMLAWARSLWQGRLSQAALMDIRRRIYDRAQKQSFSYHDQRHSGTLISHLVEDVRSTTLFFENSLFILIETLLFMIFAQLFIAMHCLQAGIAVSLTMGTALILALLLWRHNLPLFETTKQHFARMVSVFTENMEGQLVTRAYGQRQAQEQRFAAAVDHMQIAALRETHWQIMSHQLIGWGACLSFIAAIGTYIHVQRSTGQPVEGALVIMILSALLINLSKARQFMGGVDNLMRFLVSCRRLEEFFRPDPADNISGPAPAWPANPVCVLAMECVDFSYAGTQRRTLQGLSLVLRPGRVLALIGSTGAGKSTVAQLAAGFYTPNGGSVSLGGIPLEQWPRTALREHVAIVFQETFLFAGTVAENISFGCPGATLEQIREAARLACADEFIEQLQDGYAMQIGERGVSLSGGQRQRLGLARALMRRPHLLILDSCTSALDNRTEARILHNLRGLAGVSVLLITHRGEALELADEVAVLQDGRLTEHGRPQELLARADSLCRRVLVGRRQL